ncbi:type 1 glutamine amidotransferase [Microbacterium terrae]|uniref:Trehalose utilization n=1 Tax=Microbacterium terrae TaxID=69369 RepID=A0A0M2HEB5_9MICO|nr:ThuA domain-containing protein [Microbacterium terrae]KJL43039.1 Trehalose utilization [Microbacterium terrae]MBP1079363.1 type 1 glutamine amidotransferase [Microbacterium terrae]GLJ98763.1 hypothetical protein GCM10017594_19600 [Microbacterium terrae]
MPSKALHALIAVGTGRYADPWHPFAETAAAADEILRADGFDVTVDDDVDHALAHLDDVDLLVVAAGDPWRNAPEGTADPVPYRDAAASAGLARALDAGIGILALHAATASLRDYPQYREAIGGEWTAGTSWHPPIGPATIPVADATHPVTAGLETIELFDELYSDLVVDPGAVVLVKHEIDGVSHPIVWAREQPVRAVVSAFGHDARAYESPTLRTLIRQAARWAASAD